MSWVEGGPRGHRGSRLQSEEAGETREVSRLNSEGPGE